MEGPSPGGFWWYLWWLICQPWDWLKATAIMIKEWWTSK